MSDNLNSQNKTDENNNIVDTTASDNKASNAQNTTSANGLEISTNVENKEAQSETQADISNNATANKIKEKTEEELKEEKQMRIRKTFRILALCIAAYYFISAGFSFYEEKQKEEALAQNAIAEAKALLQLPDGPTFRERFNTILNAQDTSLPTANANDSADGFVAVLSPAVEIRGYATNGVLQELQIQTRYPDAMPPESVVAFRCFVAALENTQDLAVADEILRALEFIPEVDANENDKVFDATNVKSKTMSYQTSFVKGEIDELTLKVVANK